MAIRCVADIVGVDVDYVSSPMRLHPVVALFAPEMVNQPVPQFLENLYYPVGTLAAAIHADIKDQAKTYCENQLGMTFGAFDTVMLARGLALL